MPRRRGACPALHAPMRTGDGLLVRLAPEGGIAPHDVAALARAALRFGNGVVEVTARGRLQLRGLAPHTVAPLAETVERLAIAFRNGVPVETGPLAGMDGTEICDPRPFAARIGQSAMQFLPRLGPKVSVVVDGGGALHLEALAADIRLVAVETASGPGWFVSVAGDGEGATPLGLAPAGDAVEIVVRLLGGIAALGREARARDLLRARGVAELQASFGCRIVEGPAPAVRPPAEPVGTHRLGDGSIALGVALPFGQTDGLSLAHFAEAAARAGAAAMRPAPGRALLTIGLREGAAAWLADEAERCGLVVRAHDPRRFIAACAGAPACGAGRVATRALAAEIAQTGTPLLDGSLRLHLSGCAKGCAHPAPTALALVGQEAGCGIVVDGAAGAAPIGQVPADAVACGFARLARELFPMREAGLSAAAGLRRLGRDRVVALLAEQGV
jgi:precorrin-3B synthase